MRRWLLQPAVWFVNILGYWGDQLLEHIDFDDLDGEDH